MAVDREEMTKFVMSQLGELTSVMHSTLGQRMKDREADEIIGELIPCIIDFSVSLLNGLMDFNKPKQVD